MNTHAKRDYNREWCQIRATDPEWRAKQVARNEDYMKNRASPETLEKVRQRHALRTKRQRTWRRALAFDHYGGKCACCGENRDYFLAIDHINNDGAEHRRTVCTSNIENWLFKNGWPEGFQVLCHNCNAAKYRFGECPCGERCRGNDSSRR